MKPVTGIKKKWCQEKWGSSANKMVNVEGTFLWWVLCISSFKAIVYVIDKQSVTCRIYLLFQWLCVPSVKITTCVFNSFNTTFCTKEHRTHRTHQAISCYTLLHQASRGEGKNILRKRTDILVSDRDLQRFFFIILP